MLSCLTLRSRVRFRFSFTYSDLNVNFFFRVDFFAGSLFNELFCLIANIEMWN